VSEREDRLRKQREAVRASRQRNGYRTDRARRRAESRCATWVREHCPELWQEFYQAELVRIADERRTA
jgi:hypothetical protein